MAIDNSYFFLDNGKVRATQAFLECFRRNWRRSGLIPDEELIYRSLLMVREHSPDLDEGDFLATRRMVFMFRFGERKGVHEMLSQESPMPLGDREKIALQLKNRWLELNGGKNPDMLTSLFELQIQNARKVIADGSNFAPELIMYKGKDAEAWRATMPKDYKRWGNLEEVESKVESFLQICAENEGPYLQRTFVIDRVARTLVEIDSAGQSRMPRRWGLYESSPPASTQASSPYG